MPRDLEKVFSDIYVNNVWGGKVGEIYSGGGSDDENTAIYVALVNRFIQDNKIRSIVDLGCGDFRVGLQLDKEKSQYIGTDIVPSVVERNQELHGRENIDFRCINIVEDSLPLGELCLIRQVLQHLSNEDILCVLRKLSVYRHVLITDGTPIRNEGSPNRDKPSDNSTRVAKFRSGLYLELPPFNQSGKVVLEYRVWIENLRTFYIRND